MIPLIGWPDPPVTTAIIGGAAALLAAWLTWVASGAGRLQARVDKLETRVQTLEDEKTALARQLTAAASFINRVGLWIAGGHRGRMPQPPEQILPHIDAELWESPSESQPWAE